MVILGLGSNIGDRVAFLRSAVALLSEHVKILKFSSIYENSALLPENAPDSWNMPYLNMALMGETTLAPAELLKTIKAIENALGRKSDGPRWSPREIDIDILACGEKIVRSDALIIPHARLLERSFALLPFAEVAPDWAWPLPGRCFKQTARQLAVQALIRFPQHSIVKTDIVLSEPCPA